jgi:hypothetical protein
MHLICKKKRGYQQKECTKDGMRLPSTRRQIHAIVLTDWDSWCFLLVPQDLESNMKTKNALQHVNPDVKISTVS